MSHGGGHKGVRRYFSNRFTKVHLEPLIPKDIFIFVSEKFPSIPLEVVKNMTAFNNAVHPDVEMLRESEILEVYESLFPLV
jgi:midasin (ATPase involved in ribosome maturation)